jgi:hypothetical protein
MLEQALAEHFRAHWRSAETHDAVLWFDPDGEYEALLDHLRGLGRTEEVPVEQDAVSQVDL